MGQERRLCPLAWFHLPPCVSEEDFIQWGLCILLPVNVPISPSSPQSPTPDCLFSFRDVKEDLRKSCYSNAKAKHGPKTHHICFYFGYGANSFGKKKKMKRNGGGRRRMREWRATCTCCWCFSHNNVSDYILPLPHLFPFLIAAVPFKNIELFTKANEAAMVKALKRDKAKIADAIKEASEEAAKPMEERSPGPPDTKSIKKQEQEEKKLARALERQRKKEEKKAKNKKEKGAAGKKKRKKEEEGGGE